MNYKVSAISATSRPAARTTDLPHGLHSTVTPHDAPWAHGRCAGTSAGEQVLLTRDPGHVPLPHWTLVPSDAALLCSRCFRASGLVASSKHLWDSDLQQTRGLPRTQAPEGRQSRADQTIPWGSSQLTAPLLTGPSAARGLTQDLQGASYPDGDQPPARLLLLKEWWQTHEGVASGQEDTQTKGHWLKPRGHSGVTFPFSPKPTSGAAGL